MRRLRRIFLAVLSLWRIFLAGRKSLWIFLTASIRFWRIFLAVHEEVAENIPSCLEEVVKIIPSWQEEFVDMPN